MSRKRQRHLVLLGLHVEAELLARAGNGESFFVKKLFYAQHGLHVLATVHSLPGAALDRFELGEFCFPEAEHVGREPTETRDLPDSKVEFFRHDDFRRRPGLRLGVSAHQLQSWPGGRQVRSTVSSMIRRARQHFLAQSKKPLDFVSSRGLSKPNCENVSRTLSVSSFLLPFSLLASIFLLDDF